jgi:putative membrane protein
MRAASAAILLAFGTGTFAHVGARLTAPSLTWIVEPWVIGAIVLCAYAYARGLRRLWAHAGVSRGIRAVQATFFAGGLATLILALVSPLDDLGTRLFAVHMAQHELLMLIAAPLLVLGRPIATWLWALPPTWRRSLGGVAKNATFAATWSAVTAPAPAWIQHAIVIWIWHAPMLFDAALANAGIHALQHMSFLASALLFWWTLLRSPRTTSQPGLAAIYLFTTMLHTGGLGALLTLSTAVWYSPYIETAPTWGLTALEDQQLGGLIMWIPAGAVYAAAGLFLLARWLRSPDIAIRWSTGQSPKPESTLR